MALNALLLGVCFDANLRLEKVEVDLLPIRVDNDELIERDLDVDQFVALLLYHRLRVHDDDHELFLQLVHGRELV